jgi:hypothetical protein
MLWWGGHVRSLSFLRHYAWTTIPAALSARVTIRLMSLPERIVLNTQTLHGKPVIRERHTVGPSNSCQSPWPRPKGNEIFENCGVRSRRTLIAGR